MSERRMDVSGFVSVYVQKERRVVWTGEKCCVFMHVERLGCSVRGETTGVQVYVARLQCKCGCRNGVCV